MNIGYSGTPVLKKLGIKPPMRLLVPAAHIGELLHLDENVWEEMLW